MAEASIYDLANLQQMQTGLAPLVNYAGDQAEFNKQRYLRELAGQQHLRQAEAEARIHAAASMAQIAAQRNAIAAENRLDREFRKDLSKDEQAFRSKEAKDRDAADLAQVNARVDAELKAIDKRAEKQRIDFYQKHGVTPKRADESDEAFLARAHSEYRKINQDAANALGVQHDNLQGQLAEATHRADQNHMHAADLAARQELGITGPADLAKPGMSANYSEAVARHLSTLPKSIEDMKNIARLQSEIMNIQGLKKAMLDEALASGADIRGYFGAMPPRSSGPSGVDNYGNLPPLPPSGSPVTPSAKPQASDFVGAQNQMFAGPPVPPVPQPRRDWSQVPPLPTNIAEIANQNPFIPGWGKLYGGRPQPQETGDMMQLANGQIVPRLNTNIGDIAIQQAFIPGYGPIRGAGAGVGGGAIPQPVGPVLPPWAMPANGQNDNDRSNWVINNSLLRNQWQNSGMPLPDFIQQNRFVIDKEILQPRN